MSDYPPGMTLRPIVNWPGVFTAQRRRAPFRANLTSTLGTLRHELHQLGDGGPRSWYDRSAYPPSVLQLALRERDIRLDGMPRADAKVAHPGIVLSIEPAGQPPMSFPCDSFEDWQDNLRAVTLTLEALRKIDRYGVTQTGQQYRGWQALEAKPVAPGFSVEQAEQFLRDVVRADDMFDASLRTGTLSQMYRRAKGIAHPDRHQGDRDQWDHVEAAAAVLRAAGRLP